MPAGILHIMLPKIFKCHLVQVTASDGQWLLPKGVMESKIFIPEVVRVTRSETTRSAQTHHSLSLAKSCGILRHSVSPRRSLTHRVTSSRAGKSLRAGSVLLCPTLSLRCMTCLHVLFSYISSPLFVTCEPVSKIATAGCV